MSPPRRRLRSALIITMAGLVSGTALAYLLPGDFILKRAEEQWKGAGGITVQREVSRPGEAAPVAEQVVFKAGRVRIETDGKSWVWPDEAATAPDPGHRPGVIDGIFLQPPGGLARTAASLGIDVEQVTLDRLPTPDAPLPFRTLFRLGGDKATAPFLSIEKDRWYIRTLQFREQPDGPIWRAEYDGQTTRKDLPLWLPVRLQVFRSGTLYESIAIRRSGASK